MSLALVRPGVRPDATTQYPCDSLESFKRSVRDFLQLNDNPTLIGAAVSACGWETQSGISMPNHQFRLHRNDLRELLNIQRLHIVNDCVSRAMAVHRLYDTEVVKICGGESDETLARAMIGAGTGLGMAGIITDEFNRATVLPCEGGHTDLAVTTDREQLVFDRLRKKYGHVSRERVASMIGLREIYFALGQADEPADESFSAADILALAHKGDARALETIDLCTGWLAAMASDVALMLGARGGIYLSGHLINALEGLLNWQSFSDRFNDKGRLRPFLEDIPVYITRVPDIELVGLTTLFE
ncbi:MAG: glucokinase [Asticcacaulis sp.]